jgi:hypothetical protein
MIVCVTCRWTHTDRREAVAAVAGGVTPDMLQAHATKCLTSLHFELLCHGNLSPNEASHTPMHCTLGYLDVKHQL